jgi:hypothetical protein
MMSFIHSCRIRIFWTAAFTGVFWLFFALNTSAAAPAKIEYVVTFLPDKKSADVRINIDRAKWLKRARFNLAKHALKNVKGSGEIERDGDALIWRPNTKGSAYLRYRIPVVHQRSSGEYDAYITDDWALLRGEDLVPPVSVRRLKNAQTEIYVSFVLPSTWTSVNSGWYRTRDSRTFRLGERKNVFSRPDGWLIAGILGTRHEQLFKTQVTVSAPRGHDFRQMELLTFLSMVWPHIDNLFVTMPEKIMITGASDPMWRGGLSSPTSLYLHSDRPLVSENGTSTLVHELFHVISGVHGKKNEDWIAEGLAEFYAVELVFRAGGFSPGRRDKIFSDLEQWGREVKSLRQRRSSGVVTARAAVFFNELDREILQKSRGRYRLDHLLQKVITEKYIGVADLQAQYQALLEVESPLLNSALVRD